MMINNDIVHFTCFIAIKALLFISDDTPFVTKNIKKD